MNIVYLIGNGFDLNLGMPTRYKDFYKHLSQIECIGCIEDLKKEIERDIENWSDLELAVGQYLDKIESAAEAASLHDALIEHLAAYLESVDNKYITELPESQSADFQIPEDTYFFDGNHQKILFDYLSNPQVYGLLPGHAAEIEAHRSRWAAYEWKINVMTFNYTKTFEKLLKNSNKPIQTGGHQSSRIVVSEIEHIHGYTDARMIFGLNDHSQIANKRFRDEAVVLDRFIKSDCNDTYALKHVAKCERWLKEANLICLYGLSFGDTDKKWWEIIGDTLLSKSNNCKVILFEHNPGRSFNRNQGPALKEEKERIKTRFLSQAGLDQDAATEQIRNSIYVAYNSDMFKFETMGIEDRIGKITSRYKESR